MSDETADPIRATIVSGSLGAGKTTLLNHLLAETDQRIAVVVNDVGELNVDAERVESRSSFDGESELVALSNGCICCGLEGDLETELLELADSDGIDRLVVEPSGLSEPEPIARLLGSPGPVGGRYRLDSVVTVVDAPRFGAAFDATVERTGPNEDGVRPLSDLTVEQVEFCDLLVANKRDLLDDEAADRIEGLLRSLQPTAAFVWSTFGRVDPATILASDRFDPEHVEAGSGWKRALDERTAAHHAGSEGNDNDVHGHADHGDHAAHDHADHPHPPEAYGLESIVYERTRPFHPERFAEWLSAVPSALVRSKDRVWVANRSRFALELGQAGSHVRVDVTERWVDGSPTSQRRRPIRTARKSGPDPRLDWC